MASILRVLGQAYPTANVETTFYTCATNSVVISTFFICNSGPSQDLVSARICVGGASSDNKQLLCSNLVIGGSSILEITAGLTLANTDVIKVTSQTGTTTFQLFGQENM